MAERFSASVAARQMACHASANLELAIPGWVEPVDDRTADTAANRGTTMHEYFASIMTLPTADIVAMGKAIQYVADIRATRRFKALVEQPVRVEWLVGRPMTTADLVLYTADELHVFDLKTGRMPVEVVDNEQLLFYGVTYQPLAPKADGVTLHIVQPWADSMQSWFASSRRLAEFRNDAQLAEKHIIAEDLTFGPSDHCTFCPANPHARGLKGAPCCPVMLQLLYPKVCDEDEILAL